MDKYVLCKNVHNTIIFILEVTMLYMQLYVTMFWKSYNLGLVKKNAVLHLLMKYYLNCWTDLNMFNAEKISSNVHATTFLQGHKSQMDIAILGCSTYTF